MRYAVIAAERDVPESEFVLVSVVSSMDKAYEVCQDVSICGHTPVIIHLRNVADFRDLRLQVS